MANFQSNYDNFSSSPKIKFGPCVFDSHSEEPLYGMKILLVEDSPDNQALLKIILHKVGAELDIASNGLEGLELARKNPYSAVLMDLHMPKMDGHEATKILREEGYSFPIIAFTAYALTEEKKRCLSSGFTKFLPKPLKREELYKVLRELRSQNYNS